jgi:hypothetical protein
MLEVKELMHEIYIKFSAMSQIVKFIVLAFTLHSCSISNVATNSPVSSPSDSPSQKSSGQSNNEMSNQNNPIVIKFFSTENGIDFPNVCLEKWKESGFVLFVQPVGVEDNKFCEFSVFDGVIMLAGGELIIEKVNNQFIGANRIEVDITDYCGAECTALELKDEATNVAITTYNKLSSQKETLVINCDGTKSQNRLSIRSYEGEVTEVRFYY